MFERIQVGEMEGQEGGAVSRWAKSLFDPDLESLSRILSQIYVWSRSRIL